MSGHECARKPPQTEDETGQALTQMGRYAESCEALEAAVRTQDREQVARRMWQWRAVRSDIDESGAYDLTVALAKADAPRSEWPERARDLLTRTAGGEAVAGAHLEHLTRAASQEISMSDPSACKTVADAMIPTEWNPTRDLVVLCGGQLEILAKALIARGQKRIVIVSSAPGGRQANEATPVPIATCRDELDGILQRWTSDPPKRFANAASDDAAETAAETLDYVRSAMPEMVLSANTVAKHGGNMVNQVVGNLATLAAHPSVALLGDALAGRPMIIVAPGPSLAKNLDQLRSLADRAVITAFSHSIGALNRIGVVPDLVVSSDPLDQSAYFADLPVAEVAAFFSVAAVHPATTALAPRRHFMFAANRELDIWPFRALGEELHIDNAGSVAAVSLMIARHLGADPILFVGLDLSFPDGRFYIDAVKGGERRVTVSEDGASLDIGTATAERACTVPGYYGGDVPTMPIFQVLHNWFVRKAEAMAGTGPRLINCTEGGAFIAGMEHRPLAEAASALASDAIDVAGLLDSAAAVDATARRHRLGKAVGEMIQQSERIARTASKNAQQLARVHRQPNKYKSVLAAYQRFLDELNRNRLLAALSGPTLTPAIEAARAMTARAPQLRAITAVYKIAAAAGRDLAETLRSGAAALTDGDSSEHRGNDDLADAA